MSQTSPLRAASPALSAADQAVVLAPTATAPTPANPAAVLAQHASVKPKSNRNWMFWTAGGVVAAQLMLPPELTPSAALGSVAAGFYTPIMQAGAANQLNLARQQQVMEKIAELEARRADALGNCMWAGLLGPEGARACRDLVNDRFNSSLSDARRAAGIR